MSESRDSYIRPVRIGRETFTSYSDASHYLVRRVSESHHVSRPFLPNVAGRLVLSEENEQYLHLLGDGREGMVARRILDMKTGVGVSTASPLDIDVVAHVEPWQSRLFSRGLGWVSVGAEAQSIFSVQVLSEHGVEDPLELQQRLVEAETAAIKMIDGALNSDETPPYADRFPEDDTNPNYNLKQDL